MTDKHIKLVKSLNQIKIRQTAILERLEELKETAPPEALAELEGIEAEAWRVVMRIEEAARKIDHPLTAQIERHTILYRMQSKPFGGRKVGAIWVG